MLHLLSWLRPRPKSSVERLEWELIPFSFVVEWFPPGEPGKAEKLVAVRSQVALSVLRAFARKLRSVCRMYFCRRAQDE
jgi:hypothetical protein